VTFSVLGTDTTTNERIELSQSSRREGMYILGATGTGKSTLLENLILQDIKQGLGVCVLDPHGELINSVVSRMNKRLEDVILLDLMDEKYVFGMDLFHCENTADPFVEDLAVTRVMHILEKVYQISRGTPQMNQYFINITRTLLYNPEYTILDIPWILTNDTLRTKLVNNVPDAWVRWFWNDFFENYQRGVRRADAISSVVNKLDEFFRRVPRPIFGQTNTTINLREIMDNRKILLVKLHARFDSLTNLVGSIIISHLLDAAYSRSDTPEKKRKQFNVYADEFQRFAIQDFATLFTEARKYGLSLTIAHQVRDQIDPIIKATCDQTASIVSFRASSDNAKEIAGVFDTTPPPGEWIYEKIMEQTIESEQMEWWEPQEAEAEYTQLQEELTALTTQIEDNPLMSTVFYYMGYHDGNKSYPMYHSNNVTILPIKYIDRIYAKAGYWNKIVHNDWPLYTNGNRRERIIITHATKYACLLGINLPDIPIEKQQQMRTWMQRKEELEERATFLKAECYKTGTKQIPTGIWRPEPILEWEYLAQAKRLDIDVFVGDNAKYRARLAPPPYGSDEVEKRNANKITHLPKHHACIRIETGEHTITTMKPEGGMSDKAVAERIAAIQEQNKTNGYLQLRSDVEKQILAHHESLLIPSPAPSGNGKQQRKVTPPVEQQATPDEAPPPKKRPKIV